MFPFASIPSAAARAAAPAPGSSRASALLEAAPGLSAAADRLLGALVKSLQTMAGQATIAEGTVSAIAAESVQAILQAHRPEHVVSAIGCDGVPCTLIASLDATLVHAVVELLAGGNGAEPHGPAPRPATDIDGQFAHTLVTLAAAAIEAEWGGFGKARATRLDAGLDADSFGARVQRAGVLSFSLALFGQRGTLRLALPPAALAAFRTADQEPQAESPAAPDPGWSDQFRRELGRAPVRVEAFLAVQDLALGAIARLTPGQVLHVVPGARSTASLVCNGRTLFRGELGQDGEHYALRLDEVVPDPTRRPGGARPADRAS